MNIALWIVQGLLFAMFVMVGVMHAIQPKEKLARNAWTVRHTSGMIKFIGVSEFIIGIGLILPQLTGVLPVLTLIAALALCLLMILAAANHYKHNEMKEIGINIFVIAMAAFVAYGRF